MWASAFTLLGYAFSDSFAAAAGTLTHVAFGAAALAAAFVVARDLRRRRRRTLVEASA